MIVKEILSELKTKYHPVAKALYKKEDFKVLVLVFKKGMFLKEHKAHVQTKLVVLDGKILYKSEADELRLDKYDEFEIPINDLHAVEASEDSLCVLLQG